MNKITSTSQQSKSIYIAIYVLLSATAWYYMRLSPPGKAAGALLEPLFTSTSGPTTYPGRPDIVMRTAYTGVSGMDKLLTTLVTAFLAGPAGFFNYIRLQQINFLVNFGPVIIVWSIESLRSRSRWSPIVYTSLWAVLYQTIGGAIIVPLYFIAYSFTSRNSASTISPTSAKNLSSALLIGFLLPTALMFYPFHDLDKTMIATAVWQPSPVLVNLVWFLLPLLSGTSEDRSVDKNGRTLRHLRRALLVSGMFAAATHLTTIFACLNPAYPDISIRSIFIPISQSGLQFHEAVHFIFQIDYLIIFIAVLVWTMQRHCDTRGEANPSQKRFAPTLLTLIVSNIVVGPGATLSWKWSQSMLEK